MPLVEQPVPGTRLSVWLCTKQKFLLFKDKPPARMCCQMCRDVYIDPMLSPCGHSLCESCVRKYSGKHGRCRECNAVAIPADYAPDKTIAKACGELSTYCRFGLEEFEHPGGFTGLAIVAGERGGCFAVVPWKEKEAHERACTFATVRCRLYDNEDKSVECDFVGMRRDLAVHQRDQCRLAHVQCPFAETGCSLEVSRFRLPKHVATCPYRPHECPNGCGMVLPPGEGTRVHLGWCPKQLMPCGAEDAEDASITCQEEVQRQDLEAHRAHHCLFARRRTCLHCQASVSLAREKEHEAACPMARVGCPNHCGLFPRRKQLAEHLSKDCALVESSCLFAPFGCRERTARGSMTTHMQSGSIRHLDLLAGEVLAAKEGVGAVLQWKADVADRLDEGAKGMRADFARDVAGWRADFSEESGRLKEDQARVSQACLEEVAAVRAALEDQARTYSTKILSMHADLSDLRDEVKALRRIQEAQSEQIEARVGKVERETETSLASFRDKIEHVASDESVQRGLEDHREAVGAFVAAEVGALRREVDDLGMALQAKVTDMWERVQSLAKRFV